MPGLLAGISIIAFPTRMAVAQIRPQRKFWERFFSRKATVC
jgi:hypothetical protein